MLKAKIQVHFQAYASRRASWPFIYTPADMNPGPLVYVLEYARLIINEDYTFWPQAEKSHKKQFIHQPSAITVTFKKQFLYQL